MQTTLATPTQNRQTPTDAPWIFWRDVGNPPTRQGFATLVLVCTQPGCECTEATLQGIWVDERLRAVRGRGQLLELELAAAEPPAALTPPSGTQTTICIDYRSGALRTSEPATADQTALVQWLQGEVDAALLAQLRPASHADRRVPAAPADLFADWEPGDLVSHPSAFPGTELPIVRSGDRRWLVEDLHCIDPACPCTDVRMVVFDLERGESGHGSSLAGSFVVTLPSLQSIDASVENGLLPDVAALQSLWRQMVAEQPRLGPQLEARRKQMKTLTPPRTSGPAPARRRVEPGRNDPCPCGSGKKWKKCCGK